MVDEREDPFGLVGTVIQGKYRVDQLIGEGGFGVVYRGYHLSFEQPVAIKCLKVPAHFTRNARAVFLDRFRTEGKHLANLRHDAIVRVFDFGCPPAAKVPFLVLEWLVGSDLEARLSVGTTFPEIEALELLRPAIDALGLAHRRGIAHRDIKPANLFLAETPTGPKVRVLDFGIAKAMQEGETATQLATKTSSGFSAFSPQFGAPEQFSSKRYGPTGPWTDVHALGLILAEMVSARPAYAGEEHADFLLAATAEERPTPRRLGAVVSDRFEQLCSKALARAPKDRFANATELLQFWESKTNVFEMAATAPASSSSPQEVSLADTIPTNAHAPRPGTAAPTEPMHASPRIGYLPSTKAMGPALDDAEHGQVVRSKRLAVVILASVVVITAAAGVWWSASADDSSSDTSAVAQPSGSTGVPTLPPCSIDAEVACEARCNAGENEACLLWGEMLVFGVGAQKDVPRGLPLLKSACEDSVASACEALALHDWGADDDAKSSHYATQGCKAGSLYACAVANNKLEGHGRACEAGSSPSCNIGFWNAKELNVRLDFARMACSSAPPGCRLMGYALAFFQKPADRDAARPHFMRACEAQGRGGACEHPRNVSVCKHDSIEGCTGAAYTLQLDPSDWREGYTDAKAALRYLRTGCELGGDSLCTRAAAMIASADGGSDAVAAFRLLHAKCPELEKERGDARHTCFALAEAYERGRGTKKNLEEAAAWYARLCQRGYEPGCGGSKRLKNQR